VGVVAPPWFSVPPTAYGGTEAVCAGLVDGLVALGHQVVLIGAGADGTGATFHSTYPSPPSGRLGDPLPEVVHAAAAARILADTRVDVVHDHTLAGPLLARGRSVPTVVTVHGTVTSEPRRYYGELGDTVRLVAISDAQRLMAPDLPWVGTVPNGIDATTYPYSDDKQGYVLFLGRICPDKGPHLAIDAARSAGRRIIVAGKCLEPSERAYFVSEIQPRLGPGVEFYGEADASAKRELLTNASCLVFPICWGEPFGMVMIEAMACGTPVVALRRGSVPEVIVDGRTGFVCETPEELPCAIARVGSLHPSECRTHVEDRFSTSLMVRRYEAVYRKVLAERRAEVLSRPALLRALQVTGTAAAADAVSVRMQQGQVTPSGR
jgi:glycosyltransferase involved in cell wall biosynthesis